MLIDRIHIYPISLPFAVSFNHSLSSEAAARNVVVEICADNGRVKGYGEGAPRTYVTGETQESATSRIVDFLRHPRFPWNLPSIDRIWEFVDDVSRTAAPNAALCALENALLDAHGKAAAVPVLDFFPRDNLIPVIHYGAPIPLTDTKRTIRLCELSLALGIRTIKVKLGPDLRSNRRALKTISEVFRNDCTLKVDANGAWDRAVAWSHLSCLEKFRVRVVEQPMPPSHPDQPAFAKQLRGMGIRCMADESACSENDLGHILRTGSFDMINVRLSKCGGFRRTWQLIDRIRECGLAFQIGCHLGESGLLSAAGRALSLLCGDALYFDGSYDAFLLAENITTRDVTFQQGGAARALGGTGLGVDVDVSRLAALSEPGRIITVTRPD